MLRFFEVLIIAAIIGSGFAAYRSIWFAPGPVVTNVPKNVRNNNASYRSHYRHRVYRGGK